MTEPPRPDAQRLGSSYVLDARIGSGAQGQVWRAHSVSAPDEPLAVKLLSTDPAGDDQLLDRFLKERSTLMRVRSPYVVGVRDMVVEGSTFAIVMSYVGGGDLRDLLSSTGPLAPADTARVGALIARGLAAVHAAGIVHRDVKPANVLIDWGSPAPASATAGAAATTQGADDAGATQVVGVDTRFTPRLADFGVARLAETVGASHTTAAVGTPLYMAPEVLDARPPTAAADVYSLGVVLYEMSCGVPPFVGSAGQVLAQHARRDPGRPDGLPQALWSLLTAMLAKDPVQRPSALAVAESLESMTATLAGLPALLALAAPPPSVPTAHPYEWDESPTATDAAPSPHHPAGAVGYGYVPEGASTQPTLHEALAPTVYGRDLAPAGATPAPASMTSPATAPVGGFASAPGPGMQPAPSPVAVASAVPAPGRRAPRRRRTIVAVVVALVVALVGAGSWWWTHRQAPAADVTALPVPGRPTEVQTVADVDAVRVGPGGTALLTGHSSNTWRLHDLTAGDEAPVWQGACSSAQFWNAAQFLCHRSSDDGGDVLVALDGTDSAVPGPQERQLIGASEETAVVIDGFYSGSLVGVNTTGVEAWRAYGSYTDGYVANGYVVAWESDKDQLVVLDADSGAVLLTRELDGEPTWDDPLPGGVGVDVGSEAFYVRDEQAGTWAVYDASGTLAGEVTSAVERSGWVASADLDAQELIDLLGSASTEQGAVTVRGAGRTVTVTTDLVACSVSVDGVALELPTREEDETCALEPVGLAGDDGALLIQMGQPERYGSWSGRLAALSLSDGATVWSLEGALVSVLPASPRAGSSLDDLPLLLTRRPDNYRTDAVLSVVARA